MQRRVSRSSLIAAVVLTSLAAGCEGATGHDRPPQTTQVRSSSGTPQPPPPAASAQPAGVQHQSLAALAKYIGKIRGGALWSHQARLGALDFDSGDNRFVVSMPRDESIVCAAASPDASLVAAVSESGSAALWNDRGELLADSPGTTAVDACSDDEFAFATTTARVVVEAGEPRLLGKGISVALGKNIQSPTFSANGRKLFVKISPTNAVEERVNVYAASDGTQLKTLPGSFSFDRLTMSDDGRFVVLQRGNEVDLYDAASLRRLRTVDGQSPAFHLDMLIVRRTSADGEHEDSTAYELKRFSKRWERPQIAAAREIHL